MYEGLSLGVRSPPDEAEPLYVHASWQLGSVPGDVPPRGATPKATADALNMNVLLAGFRGFVSPP